MQALCSRGKWSLVSLSLVFPKRFFLFNISSTCILYTSEVVVYSIANLVRELLFSKIKIDNDISKPGPVFNELARVAYSADSDYYFRINDDTEIITRSAIGICTICV